MGMLNWVGPISRLLMALVILDVSNSSRVDILLLLAMLWIGWATTTVFLSMLGWPVQRKTQMAMLLVDILLASVTVTFVSGINVTIIGLFLCVAAVGYLLRSHISFFLLLAAPPSIAMLARDNLSLSLGEVSGPASQLLSFSVELLGIWAAATAAIRMSKISEFERLSNSMGTFLPNKSFGYNLDDWIIELAKLYPGQIAMAVIEPEIMNGVARRFSYGIDLSETDFDPDTFLEHGRKIDRATAFDFGNGYMIDIGNGETIPKGELDQAFGSQMTRIGLQISFACPIKVDRSFGLVVCSIPSPLSSILLSELRRLEASISNMSSFITTMTQNQKRLVNDAHDVARRDLHDGVLQSLAALRMRLATIIAREDLAPHPAKGDIAKIVDLVTVEQKRLRSFLNDNERGDGMVDLVSALNVSLNSMALQWEVSIKLKSEEPAIPMERESALNIENLAREVAANAIRHSGSNMLLVALALKENEMIIAIKDEKPKPYEPKDQATSKAMSLKSQSLRQRLALVNGTAYVQGLDAGTLLSVRIPMQQVVDD